MSKTFTLKVKGLFLTLFLIYGTSFSQVGINTTEPEGILDVTSSTHGVVLPRVALTSTALQTPVNNPKSGVTVIPDGTVVYNTNTTNTGTNDVSPGMYVWYNGSWGNLFSKQQNELHEQSNVGSLRTDNGTINIAGLTSQSFTANYKGVYRVTIRVNYGGGGARVPNGSNNTELNIARQDGRFELTLGSGTYRIPVHTYSTSYNASVGATNYFAIWEEFKKVFTIDLDAGQTINFNLSFEQFEAETFVSDGDSGTGEGYVGYDIPCSVEFNYVGED